MFNMPEIMFHTDKHLCVMLHRNRVELIVTKLPFFQLQAYSDFESKVTGGKLEQDCVAD